jgi:hypothetical protein
MATLAELWDAPADVSTTRIPLDVQAKRDQGALAIQQAELRKAQADLAQATDPMQKIRLQADIAGLTREISRAPGGQAAAMPVAQPTAQATAEPAAQGSTLADLWESTPAYEKPEAKKTATFAGTRGDTGISGDVSLRQLKEKFLGKSQPVNPQEYKNLEKTLAPGEQSTDLRPLYEVPRAIAQNLAATVASGYGAIGTGLKTGSMEQAAVVQKEIQDKYGYEPSSPISKKVLELLNLPVEYVVQPVAKFAGDIAQSITGSPTVGGVVAGTVETAPMLLGLRRGPPAAKPAGTIETVSPLERQKAAMSDPNLPPSVRAALAEKTARGEVMTPEQIQAAQAQFEASKGQLKPTSPLAPAAGATAAAVTGAQPLKSVGAAAVPDSATIAQALSVASPELRTALEGKKLDTSFIRHIEADSLPIPMRLTEGQSTGDIIKISNEQNRRGKDTELANRFNEQNGQLIENINEIRQRAAPDVYGTKTIENSQSIIDRYKTMDEASNVKIRDAYKKLEEANGGKFPVDGVALANNAEALLGKKLKTEFLPSSIKSQLDRFKTGEPMTFEQFEAMRTNIAAEIRKAERAGDGNAEMALSLVRQTLEDLPLEKGAAGALKPIADQARSLAKQRFDMLKKDPAYKAAVNDTVAADKYIDKFVINGVNKNIRTMVDHLGRNSEAHQHMAAGTTNWLKDKAGIVDEKGNFSQANYNRALKKLDDVNNLQEIYTPEAASQLKTLGNVANYTQFQPRGAFVNNSNTLVGAMAQSAKNAVGKTVQGGLDVLVPGVQLGTSLMEMRARRAAEAETKKALELGAGTTKQTGKNKIQDLGQ